VRGVGVGGGSGVGEWGGCWGVELKPKIFFGGLGGGRRWGGVGGGGWGGGGGGGWGGGGGEGGGGGGGGGGMGGGGGGGRGGGGAWGWGGGGGGGGGGGVGGGGVGGWGWVVWGWGGGGGGGPVLLRSRRRHECPSSFKRKRRRVQENARDLESLAEKDPNGNIIHPTSNPRGLNDG